MRSINQGEETKTTGNTTIICTLRKDLWKQPLTLSRHSRVGGNDGNKERLATMFPNA